MNFYLTEEQEAIRKAVRELAEKHFKPVARELDREGRFPKENIDLLSRYGYMGMTFPEEYGGMGADAVSHSICIEEISRACASTGVIFEVHTQLAGWPILKYGNEEQKKRYLVPMARGEILGAFALTEPEAGSDAASIKTTAVRDGDFYILNGRKRFTTNATVAGVYVVIAYTDKSKGSRGMSAFIVEKGLEGFTFGKPEDKLGIRASVQADLIFEDCRVPAANLLGKEGEGFKIALATLDGGRIGIAAQAVGIAQAAMEKAIAYAKERQQFGAPIANLQAIQWMIADMATEIEAARLLYLKAAFLKDKGQRYTKEAAMAKLMASTVAMKHTVAAVQIHGGYGYMKEYDVERYMRDAKITEIYEGTSEIMRLVVASSLLR